MSINDRKIKHKKELSDRILETTLRLAINDGFSNITIRKIAAEINYSPGTIYLYYQNKEAIINKLCENGFTNLTSHMRETQNFDDPYQRLAKIGVLLLTFAIDNPFLYDLMFIQSSNIKNKNIDKGYADDIFNIINFTIDECIKMNVVKSNDASLTSYVFLSALFGVMTIKMNDNLLSNETLKDEEFIKKTVYQLIGFLWK